jgi:MFS family permease
MTSDTETVGARPAGAEEPLSPAYIRYALWLLLVVYTLNFLDRQIMNILGPEIQKELGFSDTLLGLLTGLAFALFYTILGIPLARFADRPTTNRPFVIGGALALWSGMTALCGLAQNYVQLALARVGVGVGEAGCTPPAHSLIADYVPRERRASAMAFYGIGVPAGSLLGLVVGGVLDDLYGWRVAFMVAGLPGIVLGLIVVLTLREPRVKRVLTAAQRAAAPSASFWDAVREVAASRAFVWLAAGAAITAFLGYGKGVWAVVLFGRIHELSSSQIGIFYGISTGVAGIIGMWFGGWCADRFGRNDPRHVMTGPAIAMAVTAPLLAWGYWSDNWVVALVLIFLPAVANQMYYGPTFACVQGLVRPQTRAVAAALMLFIINLIGLGLGPLLFGALSDALRPIAGVQSVRWVLIVAATLGLAPAVFFYLASRRLAQELRNE